MKNKITSVLEKLNLSDYKVIEKFKNGMSNHTFLISNKINKKVLRIPAKGASAYVDFNNEQNAYELLKETNITIQYELLDTTSGYKVAPYIDGNSLDDEVPNLKTIKKLVDKLKLLHSINPNGKLIESDLISDLIPFEKQLGNLPKDYLDIKNDALKIYKKYFINDKKTFIHGDVQFGNTIKSSTDEVFLIDFEFARLGNIFLDLAMLDSEIKHEGIKNMDVLKLYFVNPQKEDYQKLRLAFLFSMLKWYLVASLKALSNTTLDHNFNTIKENYMEIIKNCYNEIRDYEN